MCLFHNYKYVGWIPAQKWAGGISAGILIDVMIRAKQCEKCGAIKEV